MSSNELTALKRGNEKVERVALNALSGFTSHPQRVGGNALHLGTITPRQVVTTRG